MALRRFDIEAGGDSFAFKPKTEETIAFWLAKYPADKQRSAVIPLLWLAQKDNAGWLSEPAMREVADRLEMPYIRVYEVATFYTMFRLQPVGKHHIQVCGTTPCMLRGANDLKKLCQSRIGDKMHVTDDGRLSWEEVECLGACVNAPMVQINDYYHEDLTPKVLEDILGKLQNGVAVKPGTYVDRLNSGPIGGLTSLLEDGLFEAAGALPNLPVEAPVEGAPVQVKTVLIDTKKAAQEAAGDKPDMVTVATGEEDDLKRIKGIGPVNEDALNAIGIHKFAQIAAWTAANVDWVETEMSFPGRIERENWISQAKLLADGIATEFSKRVDAGEVESSKDEGED